MRVLMFFCVAAAATAAQASDWSDDDTAWQASYLLIHEIDRRQTLDIARHPELRETNPVLGAQPSAPEINRFFLLSSALHTGISYALPPGWRRVWQRLTISEAAGTVSRNVQIGLSISF